MSDKTNGSDKRNFSSLAKGSEKLVKEKSVEMQMSDHLF
jgi:hypothetical protein